MGDDLYNPYEPGFAANPYEQYDRIRQGGRSQKGVLDNLVIHRYSDCFDLLRAPGTSVMVENSRTASELQRLQRQFLGNRQERGRHAILNLDPPDHTRIRRLVSSAFTVRRVEQLRARVRELVQSLLDDVEAEGAGGEPVDLMSRFAFPLPFQVISDLLGMPDGDRDHLRACSHQLTAVLEPLPPDDELEKIVEASDLLNAHVHEAIEWKRRNPADDLLSAMIAAEDDGEKLTNVELADQVVLLFIAGHETTVNLIGNGTLALLRNRDQFERLVTDPDLDANAVDELLRFDSPVQVSRRIALSEMEVAGRTAQPGEFIVTLLGAANRDPEHWGPSADRLNLSRQGAGAHLSFGSGIHHCLGAALARLEGAEAIGPLVRRFPGMELAADQPVWNGRVVLRGCDSLEIAVAA